MSPAPMRGFRVARNCLEADEMLVARCPCCSDIKLLLLDKQERIRAIGTVTLDDLKKLVSDAEAGNIPAFNVGSDVASARPN